MLSGLARKLTSLFFEFCVLVISCLCKAWTFQIPFVLVCLWPLDFVSAWLSRSFLFEKCMFTGNVCTGERLSISEYIDTDICFKTAVRSFYHITINNSVLCLIFVVDVIYKPCFFFTTVHDVPRRRTGSGQVPDPEISFSNVCVELSAQFDIKHFSHLLT